MGQEMRRNVVRKFNLNDRFEEWFNLAPACFFSFVEMLVDNQAARWWLTMDVDKKKLGTDNNWTGKRKWNWQQFLTPYLFLNFIFPFSVLGSSSTFLRKPEEITIKSRLYVFTGDLKSTLQSQLLSRSKFALAKELCAILLPISLHPHYSLCTCVYGLFTLPPFHPLDSSRLFLLSFCIM